ncbi:nucleolar protein 14-like isoform x1 [Stylonychia lemnae]|uniref:Nucleolar protein 14-like isoform x1 n=1 Tax=Stylonychia lemnae TaxID=5949 RepID=A0A078B4M7_STYLE|nr:nucleolar protein 14-like isoform x1 [Stylonychia lemnae]|eukprot:CDW89226.1 nucleolar protein 14-like isoform x1 [Stylonychia lemnae]
MGRATRTMTRQSKSQRTFKKFQSRQEESDRNPSSAQMVSNKQPDLKLVQLTDEQERNNKLKFVYELPKTLKELKQLLKDHSEDEQKIVVQRIREYHNPDANPDKSEQFKLFTMNLLRYYVKYNSSQVILNHLRELCYQDGTIFASYLKNKLIKIIEGVQQIKETHSDDVTENILEQVIETQRAFNEVLQCPENSKLLDALEQTVANIYCISEYFMPQNIESLFLIAENDIKITSQLQKKFNPGVIQIMLKLAVFLGKQEAKAGLANKYKSLYESLISIIRDCQASQIMIKEINKAISSSKLLRKSFKIESLDHKQLSYLQLTNKKLKPLPSYAPLIEEDFLLFKDFKMKKPLDEKTMKKKMKKTQNDALRELRKDTTQIQIQREKEMQYKRDQFRKTVVKAGSIKEDLN